MKGAMAEATGTTREATVVTMTTGITMVAMATEGKTWIVVAMTTDVAVEGVVTMVTVTTIKHSVHC